VDHLSERRALNRSLGDALAQAFELAATTVIFLGLGYLLDEWLGTGPVFTIVLAVLCIVGQILRLWYAYEARMRQLEDERREARTL
jgi:F0F1-type ATP synthase assembly protein I